MRATEVAFIPQAGSERAILQEFVEMRRTQSWLMEDLYKVAERIAAGRVTLNLHKINRARCNTARLL